ncbi:MAG: MarR family transcriptional regulator [Chlorobi bacterium]|nr:MarR family transcriptional regulator [Chlorobiota bacterium]
MEQFDLNNSLGYYFSKSYSLFKSSFNTILNQEGYNLNSDHWTVLIILNNNPGINQSVISKIMQRDKPAITRIIDYLESENYVERKSDRNDRRAHNVFLTKSGENLYKKLLVLAKSLNDQVVEGIDGNHIDIMKETLSAIIDRMSNK